MLKRDFGSFHVSNVDELLRLSDNDYQPPALPVDVPSFSNDTSFQFGENARSKHFFLEKSCTFLNHGAFGSSLKEAVYMAQQWQIYIEQQPLRFFDRELMPHLVYVSRRLAKFVGCDATDLVLVPNVTTAVNCVIRSLRLGPGDTIAHLSIEYGAVKAIVKEISTLSGTTVQEIILPLPLHKEEEIVACVAEGLTERTKLFVVDHIPSNTPYITPLKQLIQLCHERDILVLVDGAHALGQMDLDLSSLGPDFYTSNCHKWFCSVKGAAFLYVDKRHREKVQPLVISHGYRSGFNSAFIWSGLRDYSPFLALHANLDFWESAGPKVIQKYIRDLAHDAGELLVDRWQTSRLVPAEMSGSMLCVRLPGALYAVMVEVNYDVAESIQNTLYHKYNIEVPIKSVQGHLYVRISAHVYNHLEEYNKLADAILDLTAEKTHV